MAATVAVSSPATHRPVRCMNPSVVDDDEYGPDPDIVFETVSPYSSAYISQFELDFAPTIGEHLVRLVQRIPVLNMLQKPIPVTSKDEIRWTKLYNQCKFISREELMDPGEIAAYTPTENCVMDTNGLMVSDALDQLTQCKLDNGILKGPKSHDDYADLLAGLNKHGAAIAFADLLPCAWRLVTRTHTRPELDGWHTWCTVSDRHLAPSPLSLERPVLHTGRKRRRGSNSSNDKGQSDTDEEDEKTAITFSITPRPHKKARAAASATPAAGNDNNADDNDDPSLLCDEPTGPLEALCLAVEQARVLSVNGHSHARATAPV